MPSQERSRTTKANHIHPNLLPDAERAEEVVVYYWGRILVALAVLAALFGGITWGIMGFIQEDRAAPPAEFVERTDEREAIFSDQLMADSENAETNATVADITLPTTASTPVSALPDEPTSVGPGQPADAPAEAVANEEGATKSQEVAEIGQANTEAETPAQPESLAPEIRASTNPEPLAKKSGAPAVRILSDHLARAQLSSGLEEKEPIDELAQSIDMDDDGLIRVYLFTEIQGMKDETHYHDWYLQDQRVARVTIEPFVDPMRASSAKFIDRHMLGDWRVEVVTGNGERLAVGEFTVQ